MDRRERERLRRDLNIPEPRSYSKKITDWVTYTYFWGVIFGSAIVWRNPEYMPHFFSYLGAATTVTIGLYVWKAKAENMKKLGWEEDKLKNDNAHASQYPGDGPNYPHNPTF